MSALAPVSATERWRARGARRGVAVVAAALILFLLSLADLMTGPSGMSPGEIWRTCLAGPDGADRAAATILWQIRFPQLVMGLIVGFSLGLAGLLMQTILANPLASPFTLGFSAAAGFGAALAILGSPYLVLPLPQWLLTPACAFAATLLATGLVWLVARFKGSQPEILVLAGIAVMFFFQSLQSLMQFLASPEVLQQIVFWLFGSLLKEANAASLGLDVHAMRRRAFLVTAALTAGAVSFTGTIGFVGLIAPHVARSLVGEDHRLALPVAALSGATILVAASVVGKLLSEGAAIPVGIITAVAGIPMLMVVILRHKGI